MNAYDLKKEATTQFEEAKIIESVMPTTITIGPFLINVESLRNRLIKKRVDMGKAMLDLLSRLLRQQSDNVSLFHFDRLSLFCYP